MVGEVGDVISVEADTAEGFEAIFSSGEAIIMLKRKENGNSSMAITNLSILSTSGGRETHRIVKLPIGFPMNMHTECHSALSTKPRGYCVEPAIQ